jgi:hypothetical protein
MTQIRKHFNDLNELEQKLCIYTAAEILKLINIEKLHECYFLGNPFMLVEYDENMIPQYCRIDHVESLNTMRLIISERIKQLIQ